MAIVSWAAMKSFIARTSLQMSWFEDSKYYFVYGNANGLTCIAQVLKGSSDATEFEQEYM